MQRDRQLTRILLTCGIAAGPLYIAVGLAQVLTRDGFDVGRHALSLLSNGDLGWIQIANAHQTRPLWQLLVCMTRVLKQPDSDRGLLTVALKDLLAFLERSPEIDPGGQCKARIRMLVGQ